MAGKDEKRKKSMFREFVNISNDECRYPWLTADYAKLMGTFDYVPEMNELGHTIQPSLIVEYYSR